MKILLFGKEVYVPAFILTILCFLVFTTGSFANVLIEGDTTAITSSIGDTVSVTSRKALKNGENFVKWEIVSGSGKFVDATADSTGFIPSSSDAVIRRVVQTLAPYEISSTTTKFNFDKNSAHIPRSSLYGLKLYFNTNAGGQYAITYKTKQQIGVIDLFQDSTFTTSVPPAVTDTFRISRDCFSSKCFVQTQPNTTNYFFIYLAGYPNINMKDSIFVTLNKTHTVSASYTGNGTAYVDSASKPVLAFSKATENDSIRIYAVPGKDNAFDHWEIESGSCAIGDTQRDTTRVKNITSDCKVKAIFRAGVVYPVSSTPTQYNFNDHFYAKQASSGTAGVRFLFVAPSTGTYAVVVSNEITQDSAVYIRYTDTDYKTEAVRERFLGTHVETMTLAAGDEVAIVIANTKKNANPFYINYSTQANRITLSTDGNGKVQPDNGYATAYAGSRYSISAKADSGYRFSDWQTISGNPVIDDKGAASTFVTIKDNVELKAHFKQSQIYTLTKTAQTFNFQRDYYSETTLSEIRFTWTPPDTSTYILRIAPSSTIKAIFKEYGGDKQFSQIEAEHGVTDTTGFTVKGTPGTPLYWSIRDSSKTFPNVSFDAWISSPYILNVKTASEGSINPSGRIYTSPGIKNVITAWPYGGYTFKSWVNTEGNMTISSAKNSRTFVSVIDSVCTVKATFTVDNAAEPFLSISKLETSNYPEICAQVSVTDKNSGHSFYGLVADEFKLTQDGNSLQPQVTSINKVTGVSVVIVVDQSTSMTINKRMTKAKDAIRDFINNMGPYDKTAIVGFVGNVKVVNSTTGDTITVDSTIVHQTMTSSKAQLLQATDSIKAIGNSTNIITGTYTGIQQIANESNATAVIVFSDGDNNSGKTKISEAINLAKTRNTNIYTIALESETKYPLEDLAVNTGGTFSLASDASELAGLYSAIRDNVLSQYVVCFQTPDTVQNGETHNIVLSTTFNKITSSDSIQWNESSLPPSITLTESTWNLIKNSQPSNLPLTISAYVSSSLKIESATLFLRESSTEFNLFNNFAMQNVHDSLWEFTVPAYLVVAPGLDFYITAMDSIGQIGKSPKITTPSKEPYTIFIDNDIPAVEVISVACEDTASDIKTFTFSIKDSDGIDGASLFFRDSKMVLFEEIDLLQSAGTDIWTTEFPANVRDFSGIDYYIRVKDARGATIRYLSSGFSTTEACEIKDIILPEDTATVPDTIPEDSVLPPSPRDSIVYSLIADTAEIYDRNLDGRADFVRVHFKEENDDNISSIDSVFWNSNRGEWRYVAAKDIKKNRADGRWVEGYLNKPYKYGLTKGDTAHKPFLAFSTILSEELENVKLTDKVGAVPVKATKRPGKVDIKNYMDPEAEVPPDTLIVRMSEPIKNMGSDEEWKKLFRYSKACKDSSTQPLKFKETPQIVDNGLQWQFILADYSLQTGFCLSTNPDAAYEDIAGNTPGRGGVEIDGKDGAFYLYEVKPVQAVSGIGKTQKWIPPKGTSWEELPDTLSAIRVRSVSPYTAEVYIFDGIGTYVTHFKQKFGYDGEMSESVRQNSNDQAKLGFLYWDKRSEKGRMVGTGIYIWKILFTFEDGHKETRNVKTGVYRRGDKKKKKK